MLRNDTVPMPNGSRIAPDVGTTGYGELEVQNGTDEDAELISYDSGTEQRIRAVYVRGATLASDARNSHGNI